jgi:hypothetical protein
VVDYPTHGLLVIDLAGEGTEPMQTEPKSLSMLAAVLILLAFVLRAVIPRNLFLPGGWPLGSHWYRMGWVSFWVFLVAGFVVVMVVLLKIIMRGLSLR